MAKFKEEELQQVKAMDWIRKFHPELAKVAIHIANERKTSFYYGYFLKRMGVRKGVSDLFWPKPNSRYSGLWIEVKTLKGKLSKEQKEFLRQINEDGYFGIEAYGAQQIIDIFCNYFYLEPGIILESISPT